MILEITNKQVLTPQSEEDKNFLGEVKKDLTFENPAYKSAIRFSKYAYTSIPQYLRFYEEKDSTLVIPRGYDLNAKLTEQRSLFIEAFNYCTLIPKAPEKFPKFKLELREAQKKAAFAYFKSYANYMSGNYITAPKSLIQLPTGVGKTITALYIAAALKQKTLILVHKEDLVVGWKNDIKFCFDICDDEIGLIKAKSRKIGDIFTIATYQTLSRMSKEEFDSYTSKFGLVVGDEFHHISAPMFNIFGEFKSFYRLGLTATPKRSDGLTKAMFAIGGGICYKYEFDEKDSYILPVKIIIKNSRAKFKPFLFKNKVFNYFDFKEEDLPARKDFKFLEEIDYNSRPKLPHNYIEFDAVTNPKHRIMVCKDMLKEFREGKSLIAFFSQKEELETYYHYLCNFVGKNDIILYYGDNKTADDKLLEKAESKESRITLATYSKAKEGTNCKAWDTAFFVSSINNETGVEQAVGRIRRYAENKPKTAILYDYRFPDCYSLRNHGRTRDKVYRDLKFEVEDLRPKITKNNIINFEKYAYKKTLFGRQV